MWENGTEIDVGKWTRDTVDVGKWTGDTVDVRKWTRDTVDVGKWNRWMQRVHFTEERRITSECECTDDIEKRRDVVLPSLRDLTLEVLPTGAC